MKTKFAAAMWIINYQERIRAGVAPPGTNRATRQHKKGTKHPGTKPARRDEAGRAMSGTLYKREARLQARLRDYAATINSDKNDGKGYRKPGSMR